MFPRITQVEHLEEYVLAITFADGRTVNMDFADKIVGRGGVFEPLEDVDFFAAVKVDPEAQTLVWPNDVDWDTANGEELAVLSGHENWISGVAWHPDGSILAYGSSGNTIRTWDTETQEELAVLSGHESRISGITWHPDGKRLASGSLTVPCAYGMPNRLAKRRKPQSGALT